MAAQQALITSETPRRVRRVFELIGVETIDDLRALLTTNPNFKQEISRLPNFGIRSKREFYKMLDTHVPNWETFAQAKISNPLQKSKVKSEGQIISVELSAITARIVYGALSNEQKRLREVQGELEKLAKQHGFNSRIDVLEGIKCAIDELTPIIMRTKFISER